MTQMKVTVRNFQRYHTTSTFRAVMKIALTGITGFIGQNLMPMLLSMGEGNEFLTLSRSLDKVNLLYPTKRYVNFKHIDACDFARLTEFNPEVCIHLAAFSTSSNETAFIKPLLSSNIEYGVFLLDALSHCSNFKLFVNTGSFAEYRNDSCRFKDAYLYTATKTAFRTFVEYYSHIGRGFRYITAVPYSVYGGQKTVKRLFDYILESQQAEEAVDMTAGEQVLDFIHVNDVAAFFSSIVAHPERFFSLPQNGMEFHLGTGRGTSIREVAAMMENLSGKQCNINWGGRPYREQDVMHAVAPIGRNLVCEWKASISLRDGIAQMLKCK